MPTKEVTVSYMTQAQNDSIRKVVSENGKRLFDFIRNRVNGQEEAEDIYQDVLFELTNAYRVLQPIEKMAAWLYRVARNKITDQYRKKRPDRLQDIAVYSDDDDHLYLEDLLKSTEESPDKDFDQTLIQQALEEAMDELPHEQRDVFIKHELEGLSFNEISEETGVSVNTLLSRKRYAVLHLREKLSSLYEELIKK